MKWHLVQLLQPDGGRSIHEPLCAGCCAGSWLPCDGDTAAAAQQHPSVAPGSGLGMLLWQEMGWGGGGCFWTGW